MGFRKHGSGEVLPPDDSDEQESLNKTASTDDPWTDEDQRELEEESQT